MHRVILITGATGGIGAALAHYFGKKNDKLILIGKDKEKLEHLRDAISSKYQLSGVLEPSIYQLDIQDISQVKMVINSVIAEQGKIDILINNAGIYKTNEADISSCDLKEMMNVNFLGAIYVMKATIPYMKQQQSGIIINISSRAASYPRPHFGEYAATKAAMTAYSKSLSSELHDFGIKVVSISPGAVRTPMSSGSAVPDEQKIAPDDIVAAVKFVAKLSASAHVTDIIVHCSVDMTPNPRFFQPTQSTTERSLKSTIERPLKPLLSRL